MRAVVADTSPVNYLILIDCVELLRSLYTRILIPVEVFGELTAAGAPQEVATWVRSQPGWVEVCPAPVDGSFVAPPDEAELDAGERAAIRLALSQPDSLLLIDEALGRSVASRLGIANTGTLGVLLAAARVGLIDLKASLDKLQRTNFRIGHALIRKLLADAIKVKD